MNSSGFITLVTLPVGLSISAQYIRYSPIKMCMKSDFSWCTNVSYPSGCVNMDTVIMNSTRMTDGAGHYTSNSSETAFKTIESVIVTDIDSTEDKCIVLFDTYNCQGQSLVLNGSRHPAANLNDFKFSNLAESYRQCTDRVLSWLRDNNANNYR